MKKKIIFILLAFFIVSLITIVGISSFDTKEIKQNDNPIIQEKKENKYDNNIEKEEIINEESNQVELNKTKPKENNNSKKENVVEKDSKKDSSTSDNKTTTSTTASTNTNTNSNKNQNDNNTTNNNSNNENKTVDETPKQDPVVKDEKPQVSVEQPKPTNSYIGVPNPNDFYYSFHKGHIDKNYTTLNGCYSRTAEVSLQDTVDIINTTCFEVLDGQGTVLGIYMYVKCSSGNCERYKTLVGIETN